MVELLFRFLISFYVTMASEEIVAMKSIFCQPGEFTVLHNGIWDVYYINTLTDVCNINESCATTDCWCFRLYEGSVYSTGNPYFSSYRLRHVVYLYPARTCTPVGASQLFYALLTLTVTFTKYIYICWRGYLSGARCRLAYGPADATATHCLLLQ